MARPSGWDVLGLDGDPTPGVVESVTALARQFHDFADDAERAWRDLNSFGGDAAALQWVGQTADAFKSNFGPLPGRMQKLYVSYREAGDALAAYAPKLQAAQTKADTALRQALDAHADVQRATTTANNAATDLKTAQQNQAAAPNPQAVTDAQTAHDTAQKNLTAAKAQLDALAKTAHEAHDDRIAAAKECAKALHQAQSDGIHNKHWWEHVGEILSEWGGKIAEIANDLAPFLDVLALATSWIPGVDVVTAALAEADNLVALAGTAMKIVGDGMQGHWGDALMGAGMLGATFLGGKAIGTLGGKVLSKFGREAEEGAEGAAGAEARTAEGNGPSICKDDPIDVVSGWMLTDETDLELPGVLPVVLRRAYASGYDTGRMFGPGWASTLDQRIAVNDAGIHFAGDDAQRLDYPVPESGQEVLPERGSRWPLVWDRDTDEIRVVDPWTGQTRHFAIVHHRDEIGQIRDLTAISDRNGNRIEFLRDDQGTPIAVEHPAYHVIVDTIATAAGLRVARLRLRDDSEHGVVVKSFHYDDRGRLTGVVDSTNLPLTYEWDDADRITAWINRVGYRYEYQYDELGRVVRTSGDGGYLSGTFAYDDENRVTVHTSSLGNATTFRYDEYGHVVAETDPLGNTTLAEYDRHGLLLSQVDALGSRTVYERDEHGDVTRATGPDGARLELTYDALHQITEARTPDGEVWRRQYDENGNLLAFTDPLDATTAYRYSDSGALIAEVDPLGATTGYEVDHAGLPTAVTDALGGRTLISRDAFGRTVATIDALGGRTEYGWTVQGQVTWQVQPDGARTEWRFDAEGHLIATIDPIGSTTTYEPGPFGLTSTRTGPDGVRHEFVFDAELHLTSVVNTAGASWTYQRDAAGRLIGETDFVGRTMRYEHDAAGRLTARTTGLGQRVEVERDARGNVIRRVTPDGIHDYTYDFMGRLVTAQGPEASVVYTRDAAGHVLSESINGRTVTYRYDEAGRRIGRTTPGGADSLWEYDAASRPIALQTESGQLTFDFDALGREVGRVLDGRARLSQTLDPVGRPIAQRLFAGDRPGGRTPAVPDLEPLLGRDWTWRADGVPLEVRDSVRGVRRFDLDAVGRVTAVSAPGWTETYAYDAFGNPLAAADDGEAAGSGQFDKTLIQARGRTGYEHDAAGRLIRAVRRTLDGRRKIWEYTWDAQDRLVQVLTPDNGTWRYAYDPLGRRISKARLAGDGSSTDHTYFIWDGPRLSEQLTTGSDSVVTAVSWDYEPGTFRPALQRRRSWLSEAPQTIVDEVFHAIVTDLVGTPTELITPDGRIAWQATSSLWGRTTTVASDPRTECPLRFPGQYRDAESGLNYNFHRYYDPEAAAYLSPDPLGLAPAPNDHTYVSNPLVATDPLGLMCPPPPGAGTPAPSPGQTLQNASHDDLYQAATGTSKNGLTPAGRSLQKHGDPSPGNIQKRGQAHVDNYDFGRVTNLDRSEISDEMVQEILTHPGSTDVVRQVAAHYGGAVRDIRMPSTGSANGWGARWSMRGGNLTFEGFL